MILNGPGISYTEPDIGAEFVPPIPEHPREAIVKLCEHCTNRLLHRDELLGYEYWSFAEAATVAPLCCMGISTAGVTAPTHATAIASAPFTATMWASTPMTTSP